jgi:hypothetical protein
VRGRFRQQIFLTRSRKEREEREEREEKSFYSFFSPSLEEDSSERRFGPLRVLRGFV